MVETKKRLIEDLTRIFNEVDDMPDRIRQESIYLEDGGYVDLEFFTAIVHVVRHQASAAARLMTALQELLGITEETVTKDNRKEGLKWSAEEVLKHCTFTDGILKLPDVRLSPKSYVEVKSRIAEAGGKWNGGKVQGFTFDFDASRVVAILMAGKRCNLRQEFQFFETPAELADWLVNMAGVSDGDTVLEPSAGRGAIIKAVHRILPSVNVDYFELMPENRQFLEKMENTTFCGEDFTKGVPRLYTRIFANPPFSKNQDVRHVKAMYEALDSGGVLCAITSQRWINASEAICVEFRKWLESVGAEVHEIPQGVFKASGTDVATTAIKITKPQS